MKPQIPADITLAQWVYWGQPQTCTKIADGFYHVTTGVHGGMIVSQERLTKMPESFRTVGYGAHIGCFEEDCAWALPVLFFREEYSKWARIGDQDKQLNYARDMVRAMYSEISTAHPELLA